MDRVKLNGVELEYHAVGAGEPVLLIGPGPIADSLAPLQREKTLTDRFRLIIYRQRGQAAGTKTAAPVSFATHAADAAALLAHLGVPRAHVAGHSTGADIALQLAVDRPGLVHTLALLEPPLMSVPGAAAFLESAAPAVAACAAGDHEGAITRFLTLVSGLDRERCLASLERQLPGALERAVDDADTFFGGYLPALAAWQFGPAQAAAITRPVLSVRGDETEPLFAQGDELLRAWFPRLERCTLEGIGHLLHLERPAPVAECIAAFFARHPIGAEAAAPPAPQAGAASPA